MSAEQAGVVLFQGVIGKMGVEARKNFSGPHPFTLTVDGCVWGVTLKEADQLASAARRCRHAVNRAARKLPFEAGVKFRAFPQTRASDVVVELGVEVIDDEVMIMFRFDRDRHPCAGEDAGALLTAFERFGEAISEARRATTRARNVAVKRDWSDPETWTFQNWIHT